MELSDSYGTGSGMSELGAAEQRKQTPETVRSALADDLLFGRMIADNQIVLVPPDYEAGLPEWTGDRPGEDRGYLDYAVPIAASLLVVGALSLGAAGTVGGATVAGRAALSALARTGALRFLNVPFMPRASIQALARHPGIFGLLPAAGGLIAETYFDKEKSDEQLRDEAEEQLKKELAGPIQSAAELSPEITEGGFGIADYAILAEQAGLNQSNFRTEMPLFYGNIKLTDRGMFAESEASDVAGAAILEGLGDKEELDQYIVPPLASSAGRTLGAMTVRWYDVYAPISEQTRQAGLGSIDQPGKPRQGVFYEEEQIGEEHIIGRSMLAPGEELPEEPLGRRYEEREAEMEYGIDDALAYYDALNPEEQRDFAIGLVALGYMGAGEYTPNTWSDTEWLLDSDKALERDAVALALNNVALLEGERLQAEVGAAGMKGIDSANPLRTQYLPILGYEGGLFDTEEATIENWDEFVREAQEKAGYIKQIDVNSVTSATNAWAFRNYGRSATIDEISTALNAASVVAETHVGPQAGRVSDRQIAGEALGTLQLDEEEAAAQNVPLINTLLSNYIIRNSRGLVE